MLELRLWICRTEGERDVNFGEQEGLTAFCLPHASGQSEAFHLSLVQVVESWLIWYLKEQVNDWQIG